MNSLEYRGYPRVKFPQCSSILRLASTPVDTESAQSTRWSLINEPNQPTSYQPPPEPLKENRLAHKLRARINETQPPELFSSEPGTHGGPINRSPINFRDFGRRGVGCPVSPRPLRVERTRRRRCLLPFWHPRARAPSG